MRARTAVCVTIAVIALAGVRAWAVTLEDIVELSQAGIGEVVLIELIEMDDIAYPLTPSRLRALKGAGVSDQVLLALLRSGRSTTANSPPRRSVTRVGGRRDRRDVVRGRVRRASRWSRPLSWCQPGRRVATAPGGGRPGHEPHSGSGGARFRLQLPVDAHDRDARQRHHHASRAGLLGG
jgi:hypothetical protein